MQLLTVKLPILNLTYYARMGILPFLKIFPEAILNSSEIIFSVFIPKDTGKAEKKIEEAVYDALCSYQWIDIEVAVVKERVDKKPDDSRVLALSNALRLLTLYYIAIYQSRLTGFSPPSQLALPQRIAEKCWPGEELIRYYSVAKIMTVLAIKASVVLDPLLLTSVATSREAFDHTYLPKVSSAKASSAMALPSKGVSDKERLLVFQISRDVSEKSKLYEFLKSYFANGLYLRGLGTQKNFDFKMDKAFRTELKKGFLEFSLMVAASISLEQVLNAMKASGALKKELVHNVEYGYHNSAVEKTVRLSEWYVMKNGLFMAVGSARYESVPKPISEVVRRI